MNYNQPYDDSLVVENNTCSRVCKQYPLHQNKMRNRYTNCHDLM